MAIIPLIYHLNTWAHFTVHFQYGLLWWSKRTRSLYHILLSIPQITEAQVFSPRAPVAPHQTVTDPVVRLWIHSKKKKRRHSARIQGRACECSAKVTNPNIYLTSADNVSFSRQQIDDFSFALVSPLRTEHHRHFVPGVAARALLSGRGGLTDVFVVFGRPGERHDGGGFSPFASRRLNCLQEWHCHICNFIADDVRARRTEVRSCARASCLQGC